MLLGDIEARSQPYPTTKFHNFSRLVDNLSLIDKIDQFLSDSTLVRSYLLYFNMYGTSH